MPAIRPMTPREWAMLILLSILWGGSFFYVAVVVKELPPVTIVFFRVAIAALALFLIARVMGIAIPTTRAALVAFLGMGLLNNAIPFSLIVWAQGEIPSGLASILNATTPLFSVIVMHLFSTDEKGTPRKFFGVAIGLIGVVAMMGVDLLGGLGSHLPHQLASLGAAVSYAFSALWGRRFRALGIPPVAAATGQMTAASLLLLPMMLVFDKPWLLPVPSLAGIGCILALALLSTSLAYLIFFRILATAGATNLLLVTFLVPVSAILLGVALLGEVLHPRHLVGMALIGCGLACIDGRLITLLFRRRGS